MTARDYGLQTGRGGCLDEPVRQYRAPEQVERLEGLDQVCLRQAAILIFIPRIPHCT